MVRTKALALAALLVFAGCGGRRGIVVGSKNFTEQVVLGEIIAQHIERTLDVRVERRLNLGGTMLAHEALVEGDIDLYPEYTGTALMAVLKQPIPAGRDSVLAKVRQEYLNRYQVSVLNPLGFDNSFAMVVRREDAESAGLVSLSSAESYKAGWMVGIGYEFLDRADGWPALTRTYKLPLQGQPRSMDLGLLYQALEQGKVNMAAASATDGVLAGGRFMVLEDDRHAFPPYEAVICVRDGALRGEPRLRAALEALAGKIPADRMRRLNYQVDVEHRSPAEAAREFLQK